MSKSDVVFSGPRKCEHCGNVAPMQEVGGFNDVESDHDDRTGITWEAGYVYQILRCPACANVIFRRQYWHDGHGPELGDFEVLYPVQGTMPSGMPPSIGKAFEAARKVRPIDANAYGVLIGRLLDMICADRGAKGSSLAERLGDLADRGEIPDRLAKVAAGLRRLRNVGAHADLGELTEADIPLLDDLSKAILEYVYSAPQLVSQAESRLVTLKAKSGTADPDAPEGK